MTATVVRHYVHETGGLPTFPVYALGPKPDGPGNLFEFKPDTPVPADPVDNYWPTDDFFGEHFAGFLDTTGLPPNLSDAVGDYDIQVEAFTPAGVSVAPGPGTFQFIVPDAVQGDGTVTARAAALAEIVGNAFQFRLHIDNTPCTAAIDPPHIGVLATTDDCGFLRYDEGASDPVTLSFTPHHDHDHAVFGFSVQRGVTPVTAASTPSVQETGALAAAAYTGDGDGHFTHDFATGTLLDTCVNAAFAEVLNVHAKATNGSNRVGNNASAVRAFALAPNPPEA
jgi:hypothetical protein